MTRPPSSLHRSCRSPTQLPKMFRIWGIIVGLMLVVVPAAARADERILKFQSDIQVQKDGSVEVAEAIEIRAEHDQINHGIYRDFPTRYRGPHGTQLHIDFRFEGATLDGNQVKASV